MKNLGKIGDVTVRISNHALTRMVEMGMSPEEIQEIILHPDEIWDSTKYPGTQSHKRGGYTLAIKKNEDCWIICTALYGTLSDWMRADREGKLGKDRKLRLDTNIPRF